MTAGPRELRTEHLLLRAWRGDDAALLLPILEANVARLAPWIPAHVAQPLPLPLLGQRLAGFAADFAADRDWRFAIFSLDERELYGEVDLFFRDGRGRVPLGQADRVEIGYWLREDVTGRGFATEAARALLELAATLPGMHRVEIRCDPANERSAAVPRRLGFRIESEQANDMVWVRALETTGRTES